MPALTPDAATSRLVYEAYELDGPVTGLAPVTRGAMGRIWRLELASGSRYALKELFWGGSETDAQDEVAFRDRAVLAGVTAPESLRTTGGTYLLQVPEGPFVRLYTWVDGRPVSPDDRGRAEWLGQTLGRLHALRLPVSDEPVECWYTRPPAATRWAELAADGPLAANFGRLAPQLTELTGLVRPLPAEQLVFSHRDLNPSNVLVSAGEFVLLDWENAGPTDPCRELGGRLLDWHVDGLHVDVVGVRRTIRAYREAGGQAAPASLDAFSEYVCAFLNYIEEQARGTVDHDQPAEERERCVAEVAGHLADLPNLDTLRSVLAAARAA